MVRVPGKRKVAPRAAAVRSVTWTSAEVHLVAAESRRHDVGDAVQRDAGLGRGVVEYPLRNLRQLETGGLDRLAHDVAKGPQDHGLGVGRPDVDAGGIH